VIYDVPELLTSDNDTRDIAFYLQDAWRPTPRLTVNAGLRVDVITRRDNIFDVEMQDSVEVGPRLGLNYALTSDQRNVIRASWGRVHEALTHNIASAGANTAGRRELYDVNLDGVFETEFRTPSSTALNRDRVVDPDRHQPYSDEWTVGYRRQFQGGFVADVSFVRRDYRDRTAMLEINGLYNGSVFVGYRDPTFNEIYLITNNEWNRPRYSGLEFQVSKQAAALTAIGSYTRAWRSMQGTWQPNDPASFIQPDAFANNKGIGNIRSSTGFPEDANSLSGSAQTNAAQWRDHVLALALSYRLPWDVMVATRYGFQSGPWSGPVVRRIPAADPAFGPPTVTLSNGRVVQNPLATTIRFAGSTRSDEQFDLPGLHNWSVRIEKRFTIGGVSLAGALDVLNLTNHDADQFLNSGGNQVFSPNFGTGSNRQMPRSVAVSFRVAF
jgi:hypothetical protein